MMLDTPRLTLRPFAAGDGTDCFAFLSDRETCMLDGGYEPYAAMDAEYQALMDQFAAQPNRLVVVLKAENKVIGMVHIMPDEAGRLNTLELGYVSSPHHRRQGYMSEAVRAVMTHLLATGTKCITLGIAKSNPVSLRMAEKLGFVPAGEYPPMGDEVMVRYDYRA